MLEETTGQESRITSMTHDPETKAIMPTAYARLLDIFPFLPSECSLCPLLFRYGELFKCIEYVLTSCNE